MEKSEKTRLGTLEVWAQAQSSAALQPSKDWKATWIGVVSFQDEKGIRRQIETVPKVCFAKTSEQVSKAASTRAFNAAMRLADWLIESGLT